MDKLQIKRLREGANLPRRATESSAGYDLCACLPEEGEITLAPGQAHIFPTGIAVGMPHGQMGGLIYARSGLAVRHGVVPTNCVGVIDADYTGELLVSLQNTFDAPYTVRHGDRIAQLVLTPIFTPPIQEVEELAATGRGEGRFGSTGKR